MENTNVYNLSVYKSLKMLKQSLQSLDQARKQLKNAETQLERNVLRLTEIFDLLKAQAEQLRNCAAACEALENQYKNTPSSANAVHHTSTQNH